MSENEEAQNEDVPGAPEGEEDGAEGTKKGFDARKIVLFVVLPLLVLIGAGAGLYFSGILDSALTPEEEQAENTEGEAAEIETVSAFLEIPTMIVNLNSDDGAPRFLRLTVQLELKSETDVAAVQAVIPRVTDQFQTYLRELRVRDLRGSAGIYRLQKELLWRVNQAAAPAQITDVLFQEILIQ